jgi:hypothetical protein
VVHGAAFDTVAGDDGIQEIKKQHVTLHFHAKRKKKKMRGLIPERGE